MRALPILLSTLLLASCAGRQLVREVHPPAESARLDPESPYLKIHYMDGRVSLLENWSVDQQARVVSGTGTLFGINRDTIRSGPLSIALDSVALFETNVKVSPPAIIAMAVVTGISITMTIACIANPKSCFGSCPTFYAPDGGALVLQAEGFSSSVAPSLEATDVDQLYRTTAAGGGHFTLRMTNEALETHVVRHVDLLAIPRPENGRVHVTPEGRFHRVADLQSPSSATGAEGDCLSLVRDLDSLERTSSADSVDLAAREIVEVVFDRAPDGNPGIVLGFRESLMTTYLFYQSLAYLGRQAPAWMASCQRDPNGTRQRLDALDNVLGGIELLVQDSTGEWEVVAKAEESGPIATNVQILPLPRRTHAFPLHVRLRMAKGLWRLNSIALASMREEVAPLRLHPVEVLRGGVRDDGALARLLDTSLTLVSMPGDTFDISYTLPERAGERWDLFLESRGYYLEWIRDEWVAEENPGRIALMFINPAGYLKAEAAAFKQVEPTMEDIFWRSRYVRTH